MRWASSPVHEVGRILEHKRLEHASSVASLIAADLLAHAVALQAMPVPEPTTLTAMEQAAAGQKAVEEAAAVPLEAGSAAEPEPEPEPEPTPVPAEAPGLLAGAQEARADEDDFI